MKRLLLLPALAAAAFAALPAGPASAHPLGNFSVNRYAGLTLHPDRIDATVVADLAELPTLQDPPGSCAEAVSALTVTVAGVGLRWTVRDAGVHYAAGAGGLRTSRLECRLSAPATLDRPVAVSVTNRFRDDRIGWRELVAGAAAGAGIRLDGSPLPVTSVSDELRRYPDDLLTSPPDVHSATFTVTPGTGPAGSGNGAGTGTGSAAPGTSPTGTGNVAAAGAGAAAAGTGSAPGIGAAAPGVGGVASGTTVAGSGGGPPGLTGPLAGAERQLGELVGGRRLTPLVGLLAVLLALALGAAHAALPGHGKTVLAAYLAGRRGRARDAVAVGATVTLTHTGGVLILGLLLTTAAGVAGEAVLGWLGVASGVLVAGIGTGALLAAVHRRRALTTPPPPASPGSARDPIHDRTHDTAREHEHEPTPGDGHAHAHAHDIGHRHDAGHGHQHGHGHAHGPGKWGVAGLGVAGGLVPSPSALIVLLAAVALGRTVFGVLLVIAYGLGMAATLTAAGLLLIRIRDRTAGRWRFLTRWQTAAPPVTAALIVLVGLGLAGRALSTIV